MPRNAKPGYVTPENEFHWNLLTQIDEANIEVSKWESDFLESLMHASSSWLSPKQKDVIEQMAKKYLERE